jgi:hypothetical protein
MLIGAVALNWPPRIEATAVPWPLSSANPFGHLKLTAAQDDSEETRPDTSGLEACRPVSGVDHRHRDAGAAVGVRLHGLGVADLRLPAG